MSAYKEAPDVYTLQVDRHGNRIVCKGERERTGYRIVARGTYPAMLSRKLLKDAA